MRADARRNVQRILDATAVLLAVDPGAGLEQVAAQANVSRATLYHHFSSRAELLDALTDQSVAEVRAALQSARPDLGTATEAMERMLEAAQPVVGRYRGLTLVNPRRLPRSELRRRLEPALEPLRSLITRGQQNGEFDPELPPDWLLAVITDLVHAASAQLTAGEMDAVTAQRVLLRSVSALLSSHR